MNHHNLSDDQKQQITDWVEENAEFEKGDLVTVNYDGHGISFFGSEYGGYPLRVTEVLWRGSDLNRVSKQGYQRADKDNRLHHLIPVFEKYDGEQDDYGYTQYATVKPSYKLESAVSDSQRDIPILAENSLIDWDKFDGEMVLKPRNSNSTVTLREGEECRICSHKAERHSFFDNGAISGGRVMCAVCGYLKEEHAP